MLVNILEFTVQIKTNSRKATNWCFDIDNVPEWGYWSEALTAEECDKLIEIGENKNLVAAEVSGKSVDEIRDSKISWLYPEDCSWLFERLTYIVTDLNTKYFKFDLYGFTEGFQFTKYEAPSGYYGKHIDKVTNDVIRKLSLSIQLSDSSTYEGGELELHTSNDPTVCTKERGHLILFPSYTLHEVKPVTKGTRYSLVSWVTGAPFR